MKRTGIVICSFCDHSGSLGKPPSRQKRRLRCTEFLRLHYRSDSLCTGSADESAVPCCNVADGWRVNDVDWDSKDGHYRVRLSGEWVPIPDEAGITEPNRFGPAVVWPYLDSNGTTQIRCFLPGAGG
jgi:hypothetical protein